MNYKNNLINLCFCFVFIIIFSFSFSFNFSEARVNDNTGFVSDRVWYSKEPLIDGEVVNINTAIWNGEEFAISLTVEFYDKKIILGKRDVVIEARELKNVFIPWKVTAGDHLISAKIINSFSIVSNEKTKILLKENTTTPDKKNVSVKISNSQRASAGDSSVVKDEIEKASVGLSNILPENFKKSVVNIFHKVDNFRLDKHEKINEIKNEIKQKIDQRDVSTNDQETKKQSDLIILYIKYYLLLILSLILASQLIFYGLIVLIIFYILKSIFSRR